MGDIYLLDPAAEGLGQAYVRWHTAHVLRGSGSLKAVHVVNGSQSPVAGDLRFVLIAPDGQVIPVSDWIAGTTGLWTAPVPPVPPAPDGSYIHTVEQRPRHRHVVVTGRLRAVAGVDGAVLAGRDEADVVEPAPVRDLVQQPKDVQL